MNSTNEITSQNNYLFFSKRELQNLINYFPNIKNDSKLYKKINEIIDKLTIMNCEYIKMNNNCNIITELQQLRNIYNYTHLIENAILFSIIHQDIDMKFRLELFYKTICKKQSENYNFNILDDINNAIDLMTYIEENGITTEYFEKDKQRIKSLRSNINR